METVQKFQEWAIVEIMGHKRFAGLVTEQAIGGTSFVRIDVPQVELPERMLPAFTKLFGAASIYCISPCTEETAKAFAAQIRSESFSLYEAPRLPAPAVDNTNKKREYHFDEPGSGDDDYDDSEFDDGSNAE